MENSVGNLSKIFSIVFIPPLEVFHLCVPIHYTRVSTLGLYLKYATAQASLHSLFTSRKEI